MLSLALFDLDDTLYPAGSGMDRDIVRRMTAYVADFLGMGIEEARAFRHERAKNYGTTLEWLITEMGFTDREDFLAAVHPEGEEYCIEPSPALAAILDSIGQRKAVLTNSPREHADRVLAKLGVADRFEAVYDIRSNGFRGKPHADAYRRACEASGASIAQTLFVDDLPKYVIGFLELGGRALLLDERDRYGAEGLPRIASLAELPPILAAG
jgi:putative hydrolase of the HAD superfamily